MLKRKNILLLIALFLGLINTFGNLSAVTFPLDDKINEDCKSLSMHVDSDYIYTVSYYSGKFKGGRFIIPSQYVRIYDKNDYSLIKEIEIATGNYIYDVYADFNYDHIYIAEGYNGSRLLIYNKTDFSHITDLTKAESYVQSVYADKDYIYTAGYDKKVQVYNRKDFSLVTKLDGAKNNLLSVYADENFIYATGWDSNVQIYNRTDFSYITDLTEGSSWILSVYVDDNYIYSAGYDDSIQVYNKTDFSLIKEINAFGDLLTIYADENFIYTGGYNGNVYVYNKTDFSLTKTLEDAKKDIHSVISNGDYLYTIGYNKNIFIYDIVLIPIAPMTESFNIEDGTTNFSEVIDLTNITNLTLANENGTMQFPKDYGINSHEENYDLNIIIGDSFISVNSEELDSSFNSSSTLTINNIDCSKFENIYYSKDFLSSNEEIITNGQICNDSSNPSCTNISCVNSTLTFTVSHFTSFGVKETIIETPETPYIPSGSGGGSSSNNCYSDCWTCTSWESCIDKITTRTCTPKEDYDYIAEEKPTETFACTTLENKQENQNTNEEETPSENNNLFGITAQAVRDVLKNKTTQKTSVIVFALVLITIGCFFRFKKFKKH